MRTDRPVVGADLLRAWGAEHLWIDGRPVGPDQPLLTCGLADGAEVAATPPGEGPQLLLTGGPLPPATWRLTGPSLVGRGRAATVRLDHPSVEPAHALLEPAGATWTVADLGSAGGTSLDGAEVHEPVPLLPGTVLTVGGFALEVLPVLLPPVVAPPRQAWHRPPRPHDPAPPEPPAPPPTVPAPQPPGLVGMLLPLGAGAVLAVAVHPTAGLLAASAPVLTLGAHLDARRRHRRLARRAQDEHERRLADHDRAMAALERRRLLSPARSAARALGGEHGLWSERPVTDLAIGWSPAGHRPVAVPVGRIGVAGPAAWTAGVAAAVGLQRTVRDGGPVDVVEADRVDGLPHDVEVVIRWTEDGGEIDGRPLRAMLLDPEVAGRARRALQRWIPPDEGGGLPDLVRLSELVAPAQEDGRRALATPLGVGPAGPVVVDLVRDGPHALVAGTTGAGKSELLRSWVAGLARRHPPSALTFVLVDYKGGAAFDACAGLPHVTGVVTDLDHGLGDRLLRALAAELRDRERRQREGLDLRARLVVVVDEFATLAAELPDLLGSLVDLARRGRSLGLHLVLATQRPAGAVNDDIRANTSLRVCLRTVDPTDSQDVLGDGRAAALPADRAGRAWLRVAGSEPVLLQVATTASVAPADPPDLVLRRAGEEVPSEGPTELDVLVAEVAGGGHARPRAIWLPPLPERLVLDAPAPGGAVTLGLVDRPDERRQDPLRWDPTAAHLLVVGRPRSGRTTAVRTALTAAERSRSAELHLAGEDGVDRLLGRFDAELDERRRHDRRAPLLVLAIDGVERVLDGGYERRDVLDRLARDGPAHGVALVVTSGRVSAVPRGLLAAADPVVLLALDDPAEAALLGLRPARPGGPGRGVVAPGDEVQLGVFDGLAPPRLAPVPGPLPDRVARTELAAVPGALAVGCRDRDRRTAAVPLDGGRPVVVAGPPRSGRTTALELLVAQAGGWPVERDPAAAGPLLAEPRRCLLALDDAERLDDRDGALGELVRRRHPDVALVVAVRADAWRTAYGSWLAELRPASVGIALQPDPVRDGDCWTAPLPPPGRGPLPPGRGVLVDGTTAELVQVADGRR